MTFLGSSANDACFNAWITDSTDKTNRGKVEGINSMMPLIAILVVFGLLSGFATEGSWWILFLIIGVLTISAGVIGLFVIDESKVEVNNETNYFKRIFYGFKPSSIKENKTLYLTYLSFAIFGVGIQIFMTFLVQYYEVAIGDIYVFVMAPAIIVAAIATVFYGRLYDKYGFKKTILPSLGTLVLGLTILSLTLIDAIKSNIVIILIGSLLMMCGYLCSGAVFNAKMRDHTPKDKVGSFQGIKMFAQVLIPMLIGPWIGAAAISGDFSYDVGDVLAGYSYNVNPAIFVASAIVIIVVIVTLFLVFKSDKKEGKKDE
jgi:MFS family permease